jgi:hypothetical protein
MILSIFEETPEQGTEKTQNQKQIAKVSKDASLCGTSRTFEWHLDKQVLLSNASDARKKFVEKMRGNSKGFSAKP